MASGVTLTGFASFEEKMRNLPKKLEKEASQAIGFAADTWAQKAKQDAPVDQGRLRNEIRVIKKYFQAEVVVNSEEAPWLEWGTKRKVKVPSELAAYAAQFKGKSAGKNAKKMIFEWCKRKGIEPKAWYSIYRSIMLYGIKPHPFFFIQQPAVEKQFVQDLKDIINSLI